MADSYIHAHTPCLRLGAEPGKVLDLAAGKKIAVSVGETDFAKVKDQWGKAALAGADLVEWRLDCLEENYRSDLAAIAQLGIELRQTFGLPVLATWRTSREGGYLDVGATGNSQQRFSGAQRYAELVLQAANWADGVDVELQLSNLWPGGDLIAAVRGVGCQGDNHGLAVRVDVGTSPTPVVVASHHEFQVPPTTSAQLISILQAMSQTDADVLKIAWVVDTAAQLDLVRQAQQWAREYLSHPTVLIAMGAVGAASRLGQFGAQSAFTFATVGDTVGVAQDSANASDLAKENSFSPARLGQSTIETVRKSWQSDGSQNYH